MLSKFAISCSPSPASWLLHFPLALSIEIERHFKQCGLLAAEGRKGLTLPTLENYGKWKNVFDGTSGLVRTGHFGWILK